jgi:predicted O-linked N-acetylglucosamine transferase (SPINDLY family)
LSEGAQAVEQENTEFQQALENSPPVSTSVSPGSTKETRPPSTIPDKLVTHKKMLPSIEEMNTLMTLFNKQRYAEAETLARKMTVHYPADGFGWKVLGAVFKHRGLNMDALLPMQKAASRSPGDAEAHSNLGGALMDLGRLDEAEASLRRALEINANLAGAHYNLAVTLKNLVRLEEAAASYQRALQINPNYTEAHCNLGATLNDLGRLDEAEASCRRALEIKPDNAEAYSNLGSVLQNLGRLNEAETNYRKALQIRPDYADALYNLGITLQYLGQPDEVEACYRRALQIKPNLASAYHNLLFFLSHKAGVGAQALFAEHLRFGEQFEAPLRANWLGHANTRDPERCLQIGIVSADLCNHAIACFIEPVLAHLTDSAQLSLHAYANHDKDDSTTLRLRGYFKHWHPIAGLSDGALADKIREDNIDILIDLSGHTAKNRLLTFARKPAPVQASWLGYPGTTGLRAVDYYLADRFFLPPGQFDSQFTEKIVQMPANVPFLPSAEAPPVNMLPALNNGYLTFGSFNRPSKLSHAVISLWAQILRALPNSRMVLGAMPEEGKYDTLLEWFAQEGIARERLSFHQRSGMDSYLALHQQVDICLDTFPYNGGTTTLHALWMGVPTLTLAGGTAAGRPGASILGHVGLEAFIANDAADFVQKGVSWAGNLAALADLRAGMRERFANSAMGQPALVAAGVERTLRIMWQRWCAGLPAESFEVSLHDNSCVKQEADA